MNIDIRQYIINNFKESDEKEIRESIEESIKGKDEMTLPGLGVFFELAWNELSDKDKENIIGCIMNGVKK